MGLPFNWISSAGGPLVLVPVEIAPHWRGGVGGRSSSKDQKEPLDTSASDYERACAIDDYLGTIDVGPGRALILGDEPMQTAFIPESGGGMLVRWMYAAGEDGVRRALDDIPESAWEPTPHRIDVARDGILLLDAAWPGDALPTASENRGAPSWGRIELLPGHYLIGIADYKPDASTRLILQRLRLLGAGPDVRTPSSCPSSARLAI